MCVCLHACACACVCLCDTLKRRSAFVCFLFPFFLTDFFFHFCFCLGNRIATIISFRIFVFYVPNVVYVLCRLLAGILPSRFVVAAHFVKIGFLTSQQQKQRRQRQQQHQRKYQHRATAYTCIANITLKSFARTLILFGCAMCV